jgi:hypothetical protein
LDWQEKLCLWLMRNATPVNASHRLPEDRLQAIGLQVVS